MTSMTTSAWASLTATWPSIGGVSGAASRPILHHRRARLLDADLPEPKHLLVGAPVEAMEIAVAQNLAALGRARCLVLGRVEGRLQRVGHGDAGEPRPGEVLHPGRMRGSGIDSL